MLTSDFRGVHGNETARRHISAADARSSERASVFVQKVGACDGAVLTTDD
jgi:hypothetical protein